MCYIEYEQTSDYIKFLTPWRHINAKIVYVMSGVYKRSKKRDGTRTRTHVTWEYITRMQQECIITFKQHIAQLTNPPEHPQKMNTLSELGVNKSTTERVKG